MPQIVPILSIHSRGTRPNSDSHPICGMRYGTDIISAKHSVSAVIILFSLLYSSILGSVILTKI